MYLKVHQIFLNLKKRKKNLTNNSGEKKDKHDFEIGHFYHISPFNKYQSIDKMMWHADSEA